MPALRAAYSFSTLPSPAGMQHLCFRTLITDQGFDLSGSRITISCTVAVRGHNDIPATSTKHGFFT